MKCGCIGLTFCGQTVLPIDGHWKRTGKEQKLLTTTKIRELENLRNIMDNNQRYEMFLFILRGKRRVGSSWLGRISATRIMNRQIIYIGHRTTRIPL